MKWLQERGNGSKKEAGITHVGPSVVPGGAWASGERLNPLDLLRSTPCRDELMALGSGFGRETGARERGEREREREREEVTSPSPSTRPDTRADWGMWSSRLDSSASSWMSEERGW